MQEGRKRIGIGAILAAVVVAGIAGIASAEAVRYVGYYDTSGWESFVEVYNASGQSATFTLVVYGRSGTKIVEKQFGLGSRETARVHVNQFAPGQEGLLVVKGGLDFPSFLIIRAAGSSVGDNRFVPLIRVREYREPNCLSSYFDTSGWDSFVEVCNISDEESYGTLILAPRSGGSPAKQSFTLQPHETRRLHLNGILPDSEGTATVCCDKDTAAFLTIRCAGCASAKNQFEPFFFPETDASHWLFDGVAVYYDTSGWKSSIEIGNPYSNAAYVTLDLYSRSGQHLQSVKYTLGSDQTERVNLTALAPNQEGLAVVQAKIEGGAVSLPCMLIIRSETVGAAENRFVPFLEVAAKDQLSSYYDTSGWNSFVEISNLSHEENHVMLYVWSRGGGLHGESFTLAPYETKRVDLSTILANQEGFVDVVSAWGKHVIAFLTIRCDSCTQEQNMFAPFIPRR